MKKIVFFQISWIILNYHRFNFSVEDHDYGDVHEKNGDDHIHGHDDELHVDGTDVLHDHKDDYYCIHDIHGHGWSIQQIFQTEDWQNACGGGDDLNENDDVSVCLHDGDDLHGDGDVHDGVRAHDHKFCQQTIHILHDRHNHTDQCQDQRREDLL